MTAELPTSYTDAELLYHYLGERLGNGGRTTSLQKLLKEFIAYRRQLQGLLAKLQEAEQASARGESGDLDVEQLIDEVTQELAAEGITE